MTRIEDADPHGSDEKPILNLSDPRKSVQIRVIRVPLPFWSFPMRLAVALLLASALPVFADEPIRVICFGAHPDDCELKASGVAALWAEKGHKVKFVSVTNGDVGHWRESGPA